MHPLQAGDYSPCIPIPILDSADLRVSVETQAKVLFAIASSPDAMHNKIWLQKEDLQFRRSIPSL
jgi:hypothetical protein